MSDKDLYRPIPYHITAIAVYAIILLICILALFYGMRARRNVKKEKVTSLASGFSPLDIQRIFIGKTYPRKLTRALIVHWAQSGYLRVEYVSKYRVKLVCLRMPPEHTAENAVFFDRGTYVRECDLFNKIFKRQGVQLTVNILRPLIKRSDVKSIYDWYATREDEGVYSTKHYKLKVFTFILSVLPFILSSLYLCVIGSMAAIICPCLMLFGMFVFRFVREIPFAFRLVWCSFWVIPAIVLLIVIYNQTLDPWGLGYASVAIFFVGSYLLVRFVDYREKNNLADYSDLINFKKYLLYSDKSKFKDVNYYEVLPFIYAFNIKFLVKHKFDTSTLPKWFVSKDGQRGKLL